MVSGLILCVISRATHKSPRPDCGRLNSHWTSVLLAELKSTSSSQHWFHSPSQLVGLPGEPSGFFFFLFFWEHFRRVFGCEWALGMRFEEDYQGPESCCLRASCAFQQNCPCPSCISAGKMWCVSPPPPFLSPSFTKCFGHWKTWLQGPAVISRSLPFSSQCWKHLHLSSLYLRASCTCSRTFSVRLHRTLGK